MLLQVRAIMNTAWELVIFLKCLELILVGEEIIKMFQTRTILLLKEPLVSIFKIAAKNHIYYMKFVLL